MTVTARQKKLRSQRTASALLQLQTHFPAARQTATDRRHQKTPDVYPAWVAQPDKRPGPAPGFLRPA